MTPITHSGVARIRRRSVSGLVRHFAGLSLPELPRFALAAGAIFATTAVADELNLDGTTITLRPSEVATAEVHMNNFPVNGSKHNGDYSLTLDGLTVGVAFVWDYEDGDDRIIATPPPGYACDPADCALTIPEGQFGTIYLFDWRGM